MAVTVGQLAVALRITADESESLHAAMTAQLIRSLATAQAMVTKHTNGATIDKNVTDEAVIRCAAWLYDSDPVRHRGNAMINSGAAHLLQQFRAKRSALVEEEEDE